LSNFKNKKDFTTKRSFLGVERAKVLGFTTKQVFISKQVFTDENKGFLGLGNKRIYNEREFIDSIRVMGIQVSARGLTRTMTRGTVHGICSPGMGPTSRA
jgi:hypothetical protein